METNMGAPRLDLKKIAELQSRLRQAERNLTEARVLLSDILGNPTPTGAAAGSEPLMTEEGRIIEGAFTGEHMQGGDGRTYPVPANYASKSKLVEGDRLKLTITHDGSFIYKQIGPVPRKNIIGTLQRNEAGDFEVVAEGATYKVLLASVTYYKGNVGDQVSIIVPTDGPAHWAALESILGPGEAAPAETTPVDAQ